MLPKKESSRSYSIKSGPEAYCAFSVIILPIIFSWMVYGIYHPQTNVFIPLLSFWLIVTGYLIWLNSFKIILREDCFTYQSLFCFGRTFYYMNIQALASTSGFLSRNTGRASFTRMKIYEKLNPSPVDLNVRHFSQNDLTLLVQLAQDKNPKIELNSPAIYLSRGEFDFMKGFGIRGMLQVSLWVLWGILLRSLFATL